MGMVDPDRVGNAVFATLTILQDQPKAIQAVTACVLFTKLADHYGLDLHDVITTTRNLVKRETVQNKALKALDAYISGEFNRKGTR